MIRLETDPQFVNAIANNCAVLPFIKDDGAPSDWTRECENRFSLTGVVLLSNGEDGVAAFEATAVNLETRAQAFQMHTLFLCRGRKAIETGKQMLAWMFVHGATLIWGATPLANRAARWFNRQIGGKSLGSDERFEYFSMSGA